MTECIFLFLLYFVSIFAYYISHLSYVFYPLLRASSEAKRNVFLKFKEKYIILYNRNYRFYRNIYFSIDEALEAYREDKQVALTRSRFFDYYDNLELFIVGGLVPVINSVFFILFIIRNIYFFTFGSLESALYRLFTKEQRSTLEKEE